MNKMFLAIGFLVGVNIVSGCDIEQRIFSDQSDKLERKLEYNTKNHILSCYNMIPDDFKGCEVDLHKAFEVEFENCNFGDGIACENAWKLTFTNCPQVKGEVSARLYVALWYYRNDAEIIIN